jgi:hypothetical protein
MATDLFMEIPNRNLPELRDRLMAWRDRAIRAGFQSIGLWTDAGIREMEHELEELLLDCKADMLRRGMIRL